MCCSLSCNDSIIENFTPLTPINHKSPPCLTKFHSQPLTITRNIWDPASTNNKYHISNPPRLAINRSLIRSPNHLPSSLLFETSIWNGESETQRDGPQNIILSNSVG